MTQIQSIILMLTVLLPITVGSMHELPSRGATRFASAEQPVKSARYARVAQAANYGLKGDGVTDDSDSLQRAIDAMPAGGLLQIPPVASVRLTKTILVYGKSGLTIEGSQGDSYGRNYPRLVWAGAPGATMIRWVNNTSSQISGIYFEMGAAAIAIDVDMDSDRTTTCTIAAGSTTLTCADARFKTDVTGYRAGDSGRTIIIAGRFTTTIATITTAKAVTLTASAPASFNNVPTVIKAPLGNSVSSSDRFERLTFNKAHSDESTVGLRISYWSNNNNERHQIDRVSCFFGDNHATSTTAGTCFKIGDHSAGGGANAFNIILTSPYWYGPSIGIDSQSASYMVVNGESNYATKDFNVVGGSVRIIEHRSESQRQFLTAFGSRVTVEGAFIGYGGWNAAYPVIYADNGNILTLNDVTTSDQQGITGLDADAVNNNQLVVSNPNFGASLKINYQHFTQGVTCIMCGQRIGLYLGGADGVGASIQMKGASFNNLKFMFNSKLTTDGNGTLIFCQDCAMGSNPCKGGGTGAFAKRINGEWNCQ